MKTSRTEQGANEAPTAFRAVHRWAGRARAGRRGYPLKIAMAAVIAAAWCVLYSDAPAQQGGGQQTISGFEVPEFDQDNRLRSRLFGDFARILPSGLVDITRMRIDFYDDDREVEMRITAASCLYDRSSRNATGESSVRIARENMIITGQGFTWLANEGKFEIHDDAKVVLQGALRSAEQGGFQ